MSYFRRPLQGLGAYSENEMKLPWCGNLPNNSTQICRSEQAQSGSGFGGNRGAAYTAAPGSNLPSGPKKDESSALSDLAKLFGALAVSKVAGSQQPQYPGYVTPPSSGISTTTMLIGGGLAVTALVLLLK